MSDLDKFYQLAKNIVNYPYDKAVHYREGLIRKFEIIPDQHFRDGSIIFYNYSDLREIDVLLGGDWNYAEINEPKHISGVIDLIKKRCGKEIQTVLLEGIE